MAATTSTSIAAVQHVGKKSSDQLLMKFANLDSPSPIIKSKRRRPSSAAADLVERRCLLPAAAAVTRRHLRIAPSRLKATDLRNRSLFSTLHKTWRNTVEGASRVFMEKHYHRHKRLISDIV